MLRLITVYTLHSLYLSPLTTRQSMMESMMVDGRLSLSVCIAAGCIPIPPELLQMAMRYESTDAMHVAL